jgi:hypothetical protein
MILALDFTARKRSKAGTGRQAANTPMTTPWTEAELKLEWEYIYQERLGLLECWGDPDPEQDKMARTDADEAVAKLREEQQ